MDTDEDCRNKEMITKRWEWIEGAAIGARSISKPTLILFLGNIIAKDCCVVRAQAYADHVDVVNITDKNGESSWPSKNSLEHIERVLKQKSYKSQQQEYYNNPITIGGIFKEMHYKPFPILKQYRFLVCYIDLSYKAGNKNDYKAAVLMGRWKDEYHIHKAAVRQTTTGKFAEALVEIEKWVNGAVPVFWVAEEVFLLDIVKKELQGGLKALKSKIIITADTRKKGEKITRIEAALEPLNRNGHLFLNLLEKDNPDMKVLDEQFVGLEYGNNKVKDDGPDAVEGGKYIIDQKTIINAEPPRNGHAPPRKHKL
jgi:phage terminase large subunit-like protein